MFAGINISLTPQRRTHGILIAMFAMSVLAAGQSHSAEYSEEELGQIQEQAVHILGGNANVITRWTGPVQYGLVTNTSSQDLDTQIDTVFAEIAQLSGLKTSKIKQQSLQAFTKQIEHTQPHQLGSCEASDNCLNFVIVVSDSDAMRQIANKLPLRSVYRDALHDDSAICFFAPYQRASVIFQALVFVKSTPDAALTRTCLFEEIYQSFGLFNDFSNSEYFSFNNRIQEKHITAADKALLKTVYQFAPGTPVFAVVKQLIKSNSLKKP